MRYLQIKDSFFCPCRDEIDWCIPADRECNNTCGDFPNFCPLEEQIFATKKDLSTLSELIKPLIVPRDERPF